MNYKEFLHQVKPYSDLEKAPQEKLKCIEEKIRPPSSTQSLPHVNQENLEKADKHLELTPHDLYRDQEKALITTLYGFYKKDQPDLKDIDCFVKGVLFGHVMMNYIATYDAQKHGSHHPDDSIKKAYKVGLSTYYAIKNSTLYDGKEAAQSHDDHRFLKQHNQWNPLMHHIQEKDKGHFLDDQDIRQVLDLLHIEENPRYKTVQTVLMNQLYHHYKDTHPQLSHADCLMKAATVGSSMVKFNDSFSEYRDNLKALTHLKSYKVGLLTYHTIEHEGCTFKEAHQHEHYKVETTHGLEEHIKTSCYQLQQTQS